MLKSNEQNQKVGAFQPGKVKVWEDLIVSFQYIKAACEKGRGRRFRKACSDSSRGNKSKRADLDWTQGKYIYVYFFND